MVHLINLLILRRHLVFIADPEPVKMWDFSRGVMKAAGDSFCSRPQEQQKLIIIPFWVMMTVAWVSEWICHILTLGTRSSNMTLGHFEFMAGGCWFSIEKAKKRLGYEPVCGTEEGIRRSVKWFQDNPNWERDA
jgi:sterol-4alpha-carboxylate 3-dehydrogenase (decarboxylating)